MSSNYWPYYKFPLWSKYLRTKSVWMSLPKLRQSEKTYDGSDFTGVMLDTACNCQSQEKVSYEEVCLGDVNTIFFTTRATISALVIHSIFYLHYPYLATQQEGAHMWAILQCFPEFQMCLRNKLKLSTLQMMNSSNSNSLVVNWGYSWSLSSLLSLFIFQLINQT